MRSRTLETVRATLRRVSRSGHSHAESMCAWPTALTSWAEAWAGRDIAGASAARAAPAVDGSVLS